MSASAAAAELENIRKSTLCTACGCVCKQPKLLSPCGHAACATCCQRMLNDKRGSCQRCGISCDVAEVQELADAVSVMELISALQQLNGTYENSSGTEQAKQSMSSGTEQARQSMSSGTDQARQSKNHSLLSGLLVRQQQQRLQRQQRQEQHDEHEETEQMPDLKKLSVAGKTPQRVAEFPFAVRDVQQWQSPDGKLWLLALQRDMNNQALRALPQPQIGKDVRELRPLHMSEYSLTAFCVLDSRPSAEILVTDFYQNSLYVLDCNGQCRQKLLNVRRPTSVCADQDFAFVAFDENSKKIQVMFWNHDRLDRFGNIFSHKRIQHIRALAVNQNHLFIADASNNFIFIINKNQLIENVSSHNSSLDSLDLDGFPCRTAPTALAVSNNGLVFYGSEFHLTFSPLRCVKIFDSRNQSERPKLQWSSECCCGCHEGSCDFSTNTTVDFLYFHEKTKQLFVSRKLGRFVVIWQIDDD